MTSKTAKSTKPKAKPGSAPARRPARTRMTAATERRLYLASDIAAATLVGLREGRAMTLAESIVTATTLTSIRLPTAPIKILADGTRCQPGDTRTDHVAVLLPDAGIMIHPVSLGDGNQKHAACEALCRNLRALGFDDWELARREDWNHILDLTRHNPAVDTNLYPGIKAAWHWTSSPCAWAEKDAAGVPVAAWLVVAYYGSVGGYRRNLTGFALAVRRVGQ